MDASKLVILLAILFILIGCSHAADPVAVDPGAVQVSGEAVQVSQSNRVTWGFWKISIPEDRSTIEVLPDRTAAMHLNTVRLLEVEPCANCLTIENITFLPGNIVSVDMKLTHPFPGALKLTGFDVRGIFISGAGYDFPECNRKIAWGAGVPRMLNPDGYTQLFNPTNYPETFPAALGYIAGKYAPGGDLTATLNPYVAYQADQPRCMFLPGVVSSRTVEIQLAPGNFEFGYAVDACWQLVDEVTDPVTDFPPDANCTEAYKIDVQVGDSFAISSLNPTEVIVEVFDHQGLDTISVVSIESPDIFSGVITLDYDSAGASDSWIYKTVIQPVTGSPDGVYPFLVRVADTWTDQNLGKVDAWQEIEVEYDGVPGGGWARTWGGEEWDRGESVVVDNSGFIYVTGSFNGIVDFDPGPEINNHESLGYTDIYLSKFDPEGNFAWARTWGGNNSDEGISAAIDDSGDVYVTGRYNNTVDFDPGSGVDEHTSNGGWNTFLGKFDSEGNFEWARTWGSYQGTFGVSVAIGDSDDVYVLGTFRGLVDFDPGPGVDEQSPNGLENTFLSKFNTDGEYSWARSWGGGPTEIIGNSVAVGNSGIVYVAGHFRGTFDFDPGPNIENHTSIGHMDAFLSRFDSDGIFQSVLIIGGESSGAYARTVVVDLWGSILVSGDFWGVVDFNPGVAEDAHASVMEADIFLCKLDSAGDFQWVRTWGGEGDDRGWSEAVDGYGNVYTTGIFEHSVDFDPGSGVDNHSAIGIDFFLSKFDSDGNYVWVRAWGGPDSDYAQSVATDGLGNAYVTGRFYETVDFNPGPGIDDHTSNGDHDAFLMKINSDGYW